MKTKLLFTITALFFATIAFSQDLLRKVPSRAIVVGTINSKAVFDHVSIDDFNTTLRNIGFFRKIDENLESLTIQDFGIDLNNKAYMYYMPQDSVHYIGALIPLTNKNQFESIISKNSKIEIVNGLSTIYSSDRTTRISWDINTIYVLTGIESFSFFAQDEVKTRYGLLSTYSDDYDDDVTVVDTIGWDDDYAIAVDSTYVEIIEEEVPEVFDGKHIAVAAPPNEIEDITDDYAVTDSILALDEYSDDYHNKYQQIYNHNDSIIKSVVSSWLNAELANIIEGKAGSFPANKIKPLSKNTLFSLYCDSLSTLMGLTYAPYGVSPYYLSGFNTDNMSFGLESLDARVDVVGNELKFIGDLGLNKEMASKYKEIYKKGINPKFYSFLDKDILAFASVNLNTEAYLKTLPFFIEKYYAPTFPRYTEYITLFANIFEATVDEKSIGQVFKGDNLLLFNGLTKQTITYTDYEYDDDYNYIEVERTKTETVPEFLWMFTSENNKIFQQMIKIGIKEGLIEDLDGIFFYKKKSRRDILGFYIQVKNGIVFVGNDYDKMLGIKNNTLNSKPYAPYVKLAKTNSVAFLFNVKKIPALVNEFDIPVKRNQQQFIDDLNEYGDFQMFSPGIQGNSFKGEMSLAFPKSKANALQYLLDLINRSAANN